MRRRPSYPKAGDRVRLEITLPSGATTKARRGTVVERSCGRSNSLKVRWDGDTDRPSTETWVADAPWHWSERNLRVLASDAGPEPAGASPAPATDEPDDPWVSGATRSARPSRAPAGPGTTAGAAFDEWEAALAAETAPTPDDSWETVLAGALGLPGAPVAAVSEPAPPPRTPVTPVRFTEPAPAPAPAPVPAAVRAPAPPAPVRPAPTPKAWTGDDILPSKGSRRGRKGG